MAKAGRTLEFLKPMPLTIAATASWAAMHEPQDLDVAHGAVWALETLAVALLVRAALALLVPASALCLALLGTLLRRPGKGKQAEP
jgi:hypothetical protein